MTHSFITLKMGIKNLSFTHADIILIFFDMALMCKAKQLSENS
jgi:hypothetical protein